MFRQQQRHGRRDTIMLDDDADCIATGVSLADAEMLADQAWDRNSAHAHLFCTSPPDVQRA